MDTLEVPELEHWLQTDEEVGATTAPFPYIKSFKNAYNDPFVVLHSSGTTGPPKPITVTHGCVNQQIVSFSKIRDLSSLEYEKWRGQRWAMLTPITIAASPYHIFGINILFGMTSVLPPPVPITADIFDQVIVYGNITCCLTPPRVLPETAKNPAYLNNLRRLKGMSYIGAPVPQHVGRKLAPYAKPISEYGSSEATIFPFEITDDEDWEYMKFHPIMPHSFRHVCHDNYELVILRDDKLDACQGAFRTFPEMQEYGMKDLFAPHPTKAGLWAYQGRTDDLVVAATGETFLPNPMEQIIETHPAVSAALICPQKGGNGEGLALIIETKERLPQESRRALLEGVWPLVEKANKKCPISAKVKKELVLFVGDEKPMPRGTKGFAQRAKALALYHPDITAVFQKEEGVNNSGDDLEKKEFSLAPSRLSFRLHKLPWLGNGLV
jgi:acyl-coenzyme A synthetase/AMP-(fatty) acid ligase